MKKTKKNNKSEKLEKYEILNEQYAIHALTHSSFMEYFIEKHKFSMTKDEIEFLKETTLNQFILSVLLSKTLELDPLIKIKEQKAEGLVSYKIEHSDKITFVPPTEK